MFNAGNSKATFLNKVKDDRDQRALCRTKQHSIIIIQALVRGFISRRKLKKQLKDEFREFLGFEIEVKDYKPIIKTATQFHDAIRRYFALHDKDDSINYHLFKYMISSIHQHDNNLNYMSLSISKVYLKSWLLQVRKLLIICNEYLSKLKPEIITDMKNLMNCLHLLIVFTDSSKWPISRTSSEQVRATLNLFSRSFCVYLVSKDVFPRLQTLLITGLARTRPSFSESSLTAIITIAMRCFEFGNRMQNIMVIMCTPGLLYHLNNTAPKILDAFKARCNVYHDIIVFFTEKKHCEAMFARAKCNLLLSFIGNFVHLSSISLKDSHVNLDHFKKVVIALMRICLPDYTDSNTTQSHWHPILGWYHIGSKSSYVDSMHVIRKQLSLLWSADMIDLMYKDLLSYNPVRTASPVKVNKMSLISKMMKTTVATPPLLKLSSSVLASTCRSCEVYCTCILLFAQLKSEIIAGITQTEHLLPRMWLMIGDLGHDNDYGLSVLSEAFETDNRAIFSLLSLVCDTSSQILTIIDDIEFYERETVFNLSLLINICALLNKFTYHMICRINQDSKLKVNPIFMSVFSLLMTLYERDCRRSFVSTNQWVLKEIKMSEFVRELERNPTSKYRLVLHYIPHVIPLNQRLALLRGNIKLEKSQIVNTSTSTLIRIRRTFLLEDGFRQLSSLSTHSLKQVIRVKFVNVLGLDEVGIDQDGVFKEFLEETIKLVFNPSLNLFKTTEEHKLYPSATSHLQDDHLNLFEFVGKILAKAIYEGIVVDVNFAKFFLTQMIGRYHHAIYSSIDELPSLDIDLYKNLTYIKNCTEEEIESLDLTFSIDDNYLGKIVMHNLVPGGDMIAVTNENKINYIHKMANFKMRTQIKSQTRAFVSGFRSVLQSDWLTMFSSDELQKLIAGDSNDLDLADLRRNTQYYGGFHDNHRVINWLWSILDQDFKPEERSMFLKFVTSCSKAPLLGFSNLQPSFSIRCVDTSDDLDTGDTIGSVLKGFFSIRTDGKQAIGRLPTASTCFNLLKLPNYAKRSLLREKLRYSIAHNCGFELS